MKDLVLNDFLKYIDFLRGQGYCVSISGFGNRFYPFTKELLNYDIHLHSVCFYIKQNSITTGKCVLNKKRLNDSPISSPIYSCCYAGVEEYVIPVFYKGECLMRINLSGFRGNLRKSQKFMERIKKQCGSDFMKHYNELSENPPSLDEALSFIKPIEYMAISLYKHCLELNKLDDSTSSTKHAYIMALQYIDNNFMYPLSCESLAKELNYSCSYMQYIFKKEGNTSVKAYINSVRLNQARYLLSHSDIKIIDIAYACGFSDSNYFSSAFKNKFGVSPKGFRAREYSYSKDISV